MRLAEATHNRQDNKSFSVSTQIPDCAESDIHVHISLDHAAYSGLLCVMNRLMMMFGVQPTTVKSLEPMLATRILDRLQDRTKGDGAKVHCSGPRSSSLA